jgi:hypothetical protein
MSRPINFFETARRWIMVCGFTFAASGFWGFVAAGLVKFFFPTIPQDAIHTILVIVTLLFGIYLGPKLWKWYVVQGKN